MMAREICFLFLLGHVLHVTQSADLVIRIPGGGQPLDGFYRLDYRPTHGYPTANTTFSPAEIRDAIEFTDGLPGTKYDFYLYYSNNSISDWLTWTASITTAPDPPTQLDITPVTGDKALVTWNPPNVGDHSGFKLKLIPLSEPGATIRNLVIRETKNTLRDLSPGATYELQLYTVFENKESQAYVSTNFTTKPNAPGRFIVWFRNETTLLVLWQPPFPPGHYTLYKASIWPEDAIVSETYVPKDLDHPGTPAQAAFNGLVPGRAYNISVQTVSEGELSENTTAVYRTVPLRPSNVSFDPETIGTDSFTVRWSGPSGLAEFDRYQISMDLQRKNPRIVLRGSPLEAKFTENLVPGKTYKVDVKTFSGSVASWPASGNVTTRPLPVQNLRQSIDTETGEVVFEWDPHPESIQDSYRVIWHELEVFNGDSSSVTVTDTVFSLSQLQPGRNYSISVSAVSNNIESYAAPVYQATKPSSPIIEKLEPAPRGLNIFWRTDVTSKQDGYVVIYTRNDTGEVEQQQSSDQGQSREGLSISDLYPGAGYNIQVYAVSHGLRSEPHSSFQAVPPNPPLELVVTNVASTNVSLAWTPPDDSVFTEFLIRFRPVEASDDQWSEVRVRGDNVETVVSDMTPGTQFIIELDTVSYNVPSGAPVSTLTTIDPSPVSFDIIAPVLDAENVTLQWPVPPGRVDKYHMTWFPTDNPEDVTYKLFTDDEVITDNRLGVASVLVENLRPGVEYGVEMLTESNDQRSESVRTLVRTQPLCTSELSIISQQEVSTALTLRYTPTPQVLSTFDTYRFRLSDPNIPDMEKAATDSERKVTFLDLVPGRLYNITMWTVSDGVTSRPVERQDRLHPQPVSSIQAVDITDKTITLDWRIPQGDFDRFELTYLDAKGFLIQNFTSVNSIVIDGLRPYKNYTFTVVTIAGSEQNIPKRSTPISSFFTTKEGVPGSLSSFEYTDIRPNLITFQWDLPDLVANGIITGYIIQWGRKPPPGKPFIPEASQKFSPHEYQGTISGLVPGEKYTFQIQARTKIGYGPPLKKEERMPIHAPPTPARSVFPTEVSRTMHTITIAFRKNYFSDENGEVQGYSIIVGEDYTKNTEGDKFLPSWGMVQKYSPWPPYQVMNAYPFFKNSSKQVVEFTVGSQDCKVEYEKCNGKLKPGTIYRFKIRAYTALDKFAETSWSDPISTDPDNTAILVGITVPVILIIIILLAFVLIRKINCNSCSKTLGHYSDRQADLVSLPDSVIETSRPVKLKDFAEHYRIMSADSDFRFSEEFEELKHVGRDQPCSAADLPVNRPKNRFTNILPYDHSRVKLQPADDEDGSDYINANFIPGFNSKREFIVTQGPLHSTRDDFWRMCWETNSRAIVMLTRCVEKGREKCHQYWPYDTEPVFYGDIQVTIMNESHFPDWNINEFRVMRGDTVRTIRHFHFTTWPDFGVPEPPQILVRFVRSFRDRVSPEQRPIVIHCSAGVGRSGTMIALDRILQGIRKYDVVDIFGIVHEMRKERVWMVQTEQQYICIHQCLLSVLEGKEHDERLALEHHHNEAFEDDEGIAESGM